MSLAGMSRVRTRGPQVTGEEADVKRDGGTTAWTLIRPQYKMQEEVRSALLSPFSPSHKAGLRNPWLRVSTRSDAGFIPSLKNKPNVRRARSQEQETC